jgi:uncharacterized phage-associated protein
MRDPFALDSASRIAMVVKIDADVTPIFYPAMAGVRVWTFTALCRKWDKPIGVPRFFSGARMIFRRLSTISAMIRAERKRNKEPSFFAGRFKEGPMHDSRTVANRFLKRGKADGRPLTPMQLLKLVYIAHGWMLGLYGRALIDDEVQAWQFGPVIPTLYNGMRQYGASPVTRYLSAPPDTELDEEEEDIVRQVYDVYGNRTGPALSRLTHATGTPWQTVYAPGKFGVVIPTDLIKDHYERLAADK